MNSSSTSAPVDAFILKEEEIIQKKKVRDYMCGELFCDCTKMLIREKKILGEELALNIGKIGKKKNKNFFFLMLVGTFIFYFIPCYFLHFLFQKRCSGHYSYVI